MRQRKRQRLEEGRGIDMHEMYRSWQYEPPWMGSTGMRNARGWSVSAGAIKATRDRPVAVGAGRSWGQPVQPDSGARQRRLGRPSVAAGGSGAAREWDGQRWRRGGPGGLRRDWAGEWRATPEQGGRMGGGTRSGPRWAMEGAGSAAWDSRASWSST